MSQMSKDITPSCPRSGTVPDCPVQGHVPSKYQHCEWLPLGKQMDFFFLKKLANIRTQFSPKLAYLILG